MFLRPLVELALEGILARPRQVIAVCGALALVGLALGSQVEWRSSRDDMGPRDDPDQQRLRELARDYPGSAAAIVCLETRGDGPAPADLRTLADRVAAAVEPSPEVGRVFHRVDLDWLLARGLHLMPAEDLTAAVEGLEAVADRLPGEAPPRHLGELLDRVAARLERDLRGGDATATAGADAGAAHLAAAAAALRRFLATPRQLADRVAGRHPLAVLAAAAGRRDPGDGYLTGDRGRTVYVLVSPRREDDSLPVLRRFIADVRRRAQTALAGRDDVRLVITGQPALTVDEMDTIAADTRRSATVAAVAVILLAFGVFRWKSHALLVLGALAIGIAWAYGAVWLELGYLNMISAAFVSTLIGVGIAYGIHPMSEYELEGAHGRDPVAATRNAYRRTGAAVAVSALTTSAAFFSIMLMRFQGFAELGLVAGGGVLFCLLACVVALPAMMSLYGRWLRRRGRTGGRRRRPVIDRIWVEWLADHVCRAPRTVCLLALVATVGLGGLGLGVEFNTDILDLLPSGAESLAAQRRLMRIRDSDLSPIVSLVTADRLDDLRAMHRRAASEPTVDRMESVALFVPPEPADGRLLARLDRALAALPLPDRAEPLTAEGMSTALRHLEAALAEAVDAAFVAGLGPAAGALEEARAEIEEAATAASGATPEQVEGWNDAQARLAAWALRARRALRRAAATPAPTVDDLPEALRRRFVTRSGRFIGFIHPAGDVFDDTFRDEYVRAVKRVSPEAAGFATMFHKVAGRITSGFTRAVAVGAVLVILVLLADYRRPLPALLALLPLAMGLVWMAGFMRLAGLSYNFANLVAVPLVIGVGIDNGVHLVHRFLLEGDRGMEVVMRHTGRAILMASLTTMAGFGSLAVASHRGIASLGLVLLVGVGACLLTSTVVLPNLLVVLGLSRR